MPKLLSLEQVRAYHANGFVMPISVLSADETSEFRRRFEDYESAHGD